MKIRYLVLALFSTLLVYMLALVVSSPSTPEFIKYILPPIISVVGAYCFTKFKDMRDQAVQVERSRIYIFNNLARKYHMLLNIKMAFTEEASSPSSSLRCITLRLFSSSTPDVEKLSEQTISELIASKSDIKLYDRTSKMEYNFQLIINLLNRRQDLYRELIKDHDDSNIFIPFERMLNMRQHELSSLFAQTEDLLSLINTQSDAFFKFFSDPLVTRYIHSNPQHVELFKEVVNYKFETIHFTKLTFNVWIKHVMEFKETYKKILKSRDQK